MLLATISKYLPVFERVLVVVRPNDSIVKLLPSSCEVVEAERAHLGLSQSIAAGVNCIESEDWVVIGLGDMPFIQSNTLTHLCNELDTGSHPIVRLRCCQRFGNPVGFTADFFGRLTRLAGDTGAKPILERYRDSTLVLDVEDVGIHQDIDTPDQLSRFNRTS